MDNWKNDNLAKTLRFEPVESEFGRSKARGRADEDFLNGVRIGHGGFLFSLADYASALATNVGGRTAVSSWAGVNFMAPCPEGEVVSAEAKLSAFDGKTALCDVSVSSEKSGQVFAIFQSRIIFKK